jgi:hypothetical protein
MGAMSAANEMRELFEAEGLIAPPVPAALEPSVVEQEPWVYTTRDIDPMGMYMFGPYILEAVTKPLDDYFAVSHAGHGVNSYGLNYHLVYGPIALFAQTAWGGVYVDAERSAGQVRKQLSLCANLITAVEASTDRLPHSPARLIVVESDFHGRAVCRWLDKPMGRETAAAEWLEAAGSNEELGTEGASAAPEQPAAIEAAIALVEAASAD